MTQAKVGIFFVVNGGLVVDTVSLECSKPYGDTVGYGGHYDFWQKLVPRSQIEQIFKTHAYDYFLRGRAIYFKKSGGFRLYADKCLCKSDINIIAALFQ